MDKEAIADIIAATRPGLVKEALGWMDMAKRGLGMATRGESRLAANAAHAVHPPAIHAPAGYPGAVTHPPPQAIPHFPPQARVGGAQPPMGSSGVVFTPHPNSPAMPSAGASRGSMRPPPAPPAAAPGGMGWKGKTALGLGAAGAGTYGVANYMADRDPTRLSGNNFDQYGQASGKYQDFSKPVQEALDQVDWSTPEGAARGMELHKRLQSGNFDFGDKAGGGLFHKNTDDESFYSGLRDRMNATGYQGSGMMRRLLDPWHAQAGASEYHAAMQKAQKGAMGDFTKAQGMPQQMQGRIDQLEHMKNSPFLPPPQRAKIDEAIKKMQGQIGSNPSGADQIRERMLASGMADPRLLGHLGQQQSQQQSQMQRTPDWNMPQHWGMGMGGRPGGGVDANPYLSQDDYRYNPYEQVVRR